MSDWTRNAVRTVRDAAARSFRVSSRSRNRRLRDRRIVVLPPSFAVHSLVPVEASAVSIRFRTRRELRGGRSRASVKAVHWGSDNTNARRSAKTSSAARVAYFNTNSETVEPSARLAAVRIDRCQSFVRRPNRPLLGRRIASSWLAGIALTVHTLYVHLPVALLYAWPWNVGDAYGVWNCCGSIEVSGDSVRTVRQGDKQGGLQGH